jgi:class 3 adenylate cyclase
VGIPRKRLDAAEIVSVVFVDVVGYTSMSEVLDPEDVRRVLDPYYWRAREELERYGGTVEKFIGDAVMALFGAPLSHEDDPSRALRCALSMHQRLERLNERFPPAKFVFQPLYNEFLVIIFGLSVYHIMVLDGEAF